MLVFDDPMRLKSPARPDIATIAIADRRSSLEEERSAMLTAAHLDAVHGLRHGFFTRERGVSQGVNTSLNCGFSSGDDEGQVLANRAIAMERMGVPAGWPTTVKQVHGTCLLYTSPSPRDRRGTHMPSSA